MAPATFCRLGCAETENLQHFTKFEILVEKLLTQNKEKVCELNDAFGSWVEQKKFIEIFSILVSIMESLIELK